MTQAPDILAGLRRLIGDDAAAITYQTMGQYRGALIREFNKLNEAIAAAPHTAAPAADRAVSELPMIVEIEYAQAHGWPAESLRRLESMAAAAKQRALARSTDAPSREHEAWVPFLSDRADGVRGRFALRRFDERGTAWHWNRKRSEWNAFSDEPMTHDEATALLKSMRPATPPAPATSTPCASGEGLVLAPDKARHIANKARSMTAPCDTTGPTEYVLAGWNAALAATQAPAVPATDAHAAFKWHAVDGKQHDTGRVTRGERGSYFATTASPEDARLIAEALNARTPTAGNTEDARSMGAVSEMIAKHAALLEDNPYCYFELAYTRSTEWMAWICSKPSIDDPGRKIIAKGQGSTPDGACRAALTQAASTGGAAS